MTYPCVLLYTQTGCEEIIKNQIFYRKPTTLEEIGVINRGLRFCIKQGDIIEDKDFRIITASKDTKNVIRKVEDCEITIGNLFEVARGLPNKDVDFSACAFEALKSKGVLRYFIDEKYVQLVGTIMASHFKNEMVIMPRTVKSLKATLKPCNIVLLDRIYYLVAKAKTNLKYIIGVLNSKITSYWFEYVYGTTKVGGGYFDLNGNQIKSIHLPLSLPSAEANVAALVDRILAAKKADPSADTSALEAEIDQLVYKLYGLTDEEIAVVEGRGGEDGAGNRRRDCAWRDQPGGGDGAEGEERTAHRVRLAGSAWQDQPGRTRAVTEMANDEDEELE
jgi:hypothetical protein